MLRPSVLKIIGIAAKPLSLDRPSGYSSLMRALSVEIYLLPSLTDVIGTETLRLIDGPGVRATLSKSPGKAGLHVVRRKAAGALLASSLMGESPDGATPRERFDRLLLGPGASLPPLGDGTLLAIEVEMAIPDADLQPVLDLGDLAITMDEPVVHGLSEPRRKARSTALAALSLAGSDGIVDDARQVGSSDVVFDAGGSRPNYVVEIRGGLTITQKSALLPQQASQAVSLASALRKAPKGLRHVPRLLAQSHQDRLNTLTAFIAAWAGLEILITSTQAEYEAAWQEVAVSGLSPAARTVAGRTRVVMKDKFRLVDRFAMMADVLDPAGAETDIASFIEMKKVRDAFFHSLDSDPSDLPADQARRLLRRYLTLHLLRGV